MKSNVLPPNSVYPRPVPSSYDFRLVLCRITVSDVQIDTNSAAQFLGARSPGKKFCAVVSNFCVHWV
jgi:hypothetical protein